jgi:hypothetical protein
MDGFNIVEPPVVTKKRKLEEVVNQESLKLAQSFCETPLEWGDVQKMNNRRLETFINDKKFSSNLNLRQTFVDGLHKFYSMICDKITRGDNHVAEQLMQDISLRKSIESEVIPFISMLDNKLKLGMLTATGIVAGKMKQRILDNASDNFSIIKENERYDETSFVAGKDEQSTAQEQQTSNRTEETENDPL